MTSTTRSGLTNEINVTPMIDVLLVLLIIFMAALPSKRKAVDTNLPDPAAKPGGEGSPSIVLEVAEGGVVSINHQPVPPGGLAARIHAIYDGRPDKVLFVKGAPHATYDAVLTAIDVAKGAGVRAIGVTNF